MSFAYLPLFTGDYLRDTRHLSVSEHGVYLLALMYCWDSKGPMPLDERKQFAVVNARSTDEMEAWRRVRDEFFVRCEDGWYNKRMAEEVAKSERMSMKFREAGLKSAIARRTKARAASSEASAEPRLNLGSTKAEPRLVSPSPSPSSILTNNSKEERHTRARQGTRLPSDWRLPDDWRDWARRERPELDPQATADRFRDYWCAKPGKDGTKLDWAATWRNWVRSERHGGAAPAGETAYQRRMRERVAEMSPRIAARAPGADPWDQRETVDVDAARLD